MRNYFATQWNGMVAEPDVNRIFLRYCLGHRVCLMNLLIKNQKVQSQEEFAKNSN